MSFIYRRAAKMLLKCSQGGGIKEVLHENEDKSIKKLYSILYKALEDLDILNKIYNIYLSKICKNKYLGIILLSVFVHRNEIDGGGKLKREIKKREKEILQCYKKFKEKSSTNNDIPNIKNISKYFLIYGNDNIIKKELMKSFQIEEDKDVKNLYKINNDQVKNLINNRFYKENRIRIIDKTSCLVVKAGKIKKGMVVVDICSSPGSKAIFSLISLKKKGYLICVEKNKKRCFTLLKEILKNEELNGLYPNEDFKENEKIPFNEDTFFSEKNKNIYYIKHKDSELIIKIYNCDFLNLGSDDFPSNIDVVFVDPSCSSSGMPDFIYKKNMKDIFSDPSYKNEKCSKSQSEISKRCYKSNNVNTLGNNINELKNVFEFQTVDASLSRSKENRDYISEEMLNVKIPEVPTVFKDKVKKLSEFQKKILSHALVNLKNANTFIYSTCSFFEEENEQVIQEVLQKNPNFYLKKAGKDKFLYNNYKYDFSKKCVRTFPEKDLCRGIFISKICRKHI